MKIKDIAAALILGIATHAAIAQTPVTPPVTPVPPVAPIAASVAPAAPSASTPGVAEGTLFKTQRSMNDKGRYEWICTYNVANLKRSVLFDESCPSTMQFELKR